MTNQKKIKIKRPSFFRLKFKAVGNYLIAGIFMSLAWSLRGQFGHLKGALIPGTAAALLPLLLMRGRWYAGAGLALIFGPLGFCIGGHMGYGQLIEFIENSGWRESLPSLFRIVLIGGIWGGLGGTFLGFGFSEKPLKLFDFFFLILMGLFWLVTLGYFDLESYELHFFYGGFAALQLYNYFFKKSKMILFYGAGGLAGFGAAFGIAVLLLHWGRRGLLPDFGGWWALRDQIIGFLGGVVLWAVTSKAAVGSEPSLSHDLAPVHKIGVIFTAAVIPFIETINVALYWMSQRPLNFFQIAALLIAFLLLIRIFYRLTQEDKIFSIYLEKTILFATIFFVWYLSLAATAKEMVIFGWGRFETAYLLFGLGSFFLTAILLRRAQLHGYLKAR